MKSKILLRIAAGLLLFHLIGHTIGHSGWKDATEPAKQEVIQQMTGNKFPFMGASRSMGDYFEGYGWACSIALIFFALVQWFISGAGPGNASLSKKLLISLGSCLLVWSLLEFIFFFPFAGIITLLSALLTLMSVRRLRL